MEAHVVPHVEGLVNSPETATSNLRLGSCEVCASNNAKYTCPKCEIKTCSLSCSKIHKTEIECDGQRNRTKFIPLNKFTNFDLSSDYRLLEEVTRVVESSKKRKLHIRSKFPKQLQRLQKEATARNIMLKFLPPHFEKRKNNSLRFVPETNELLWHIEWVFVNAENFTWCQEQVPESTRLSAILHKYLGQEDKELQTKLEYYQSANLTGIKLLLKAEQKPGHKFYELEMTDTLAECLRNRTIIEYPTIYVVLRDHTTSFDIIASDEECETKGAKTAQSGNAVVNKLIKNYEKQDSAQNHLKNYFIEYECSDDDV